MSGEAGVSQLGVRRRHRRKGIATAEGCCNPDLEQAAAKHGKETTMSDTDKILEKLSAINGTLQWVALFAFMAWMASCNST